MLLVSLLMIAALPALGADTYGVIYNPNGDATVNLRNRPDFAGRIITPLPEGTVVQVLCQEGDWYSVCVNGQTGYVHTYFVNTGAFRPADDPTKKPSQTYTATINLGPVNLHESPSLQARVLAQLSSGTTVTVLSYGQTWSQIVSGKLNGYVLSSYLSFGQTPIIPNPTPKPTQVPYYPTAAPVCPVYPVYPVYPTAAPICPVYPIYTKDANATIRTTNGGNLNLREWADDRSPIIASFANGTRVRVLTHGATWCRVQVGDFYGYMITKYLSFDGNGYNPKPVTPKGYAAIVANPVAGQTLNLRESPASDGYVLGQFYNGTRVTVLGVGTEWCRVTVGGVNGYMMTKYLSFLDNATPHKTVVNKGSYVNLRTGAGTNFPVLLSVLEGSSATVVIPYPAWSKVIVQYNAGYMTGYMMNSFLK